MKRFVTALALCWILVSCRNSAPPQRGVDDGTVERFQLKGVVIRTDPANRIVTIKHEPIRNAAGKVWMEAMTMDFPVLKEADFQAARKDASIQAIVVSRSSDYEYWIENVRVQ
jgi:Cu/Ag efflux protein CusF